MSKLEFFKEKTLRNIASANEPMKKAHYCFIYIDTCVGCNDDPLAYNIAKTFISIYLQNIHEMEFGMDEIQNEKIVHVINSFDSNKAIKLVNYTIRVLNRISEVEKTEFYKNLLFTLKLKENRKSKWHFKPFRFVYYYYRKSLESLKGTVVIMVILYFLYSIILLPSPIERFHCINVKLHCFSSSPIVNYVLNTFTFLFELEQKDIVAYENFSGALILGVLMFIKYITIGGFLYERVVSKL